MKNATKTAKAIETKAAELVAKASLVRVAGYAGLLMGDAASLRYVAEYLRAGDIQCAIAAAFLLETGCRDHFPEEFWKLGVSAGLIEAKPNGRRVLYVQIAA